MHAEPLKPFRTRIQPAFSSPRLASPQWDVRSVRECCALLRVRPNGFACDEQCCKRRRSDGRRRGGIHPLSRGEHSSAHRRGSDGVPGRSLHRERVVRRCALACGRDDRAGDAAPLPPVPVGRLRGVSRLAGADPARASRPVGGRDRRDRGSAAAPVRTASRLDRRVVVLGLRAHCRDPRCQPVCREADRLSPRRRIWTHGRGLAYHDLRLRAGVHARIRAGRTGRTRVGSRRGVDVQDARRGRSASRGGTRGASGATDSLRRRLRRLEPAARDRFRRRWPQRRAHGRARAHRACARGHGAKRDVVGGMGDIDLRQVGQRPARAAAPPCRTCCRTSHSLALSRHSTRGRRADRHGGLRAPLARRSDAARTHGRARLPVRHPAPAPVHRAASLGGSDRSSPARSRWPTRCCFAAPPADALASGSPRDCCCSPPRTWCPGTRSGQYRSPLPRRTLRHSSCLSDSAPISCGRASIRDAGWKCPAPHAVPGHPAVRWGESRVRLRSGSWTCRRRRRSRRRSLRPRRRRVGTGASLRR